MEKILEKARTEHILTKEEIVKLLEHDGEEVYDCADKVREEYIGKQVYLRALIEISNICKQNCMYCGLRAENSKCDRYKLSKEQILEQAEIAQQAGYKTVVMQSGESNTFKTEEICEIVSEIKKLDMAVTLSLGEHTREEYEAYKKAGADRYLLRIETTDENLYKQMHPKMDFYNRIRCLKDLKDLGYEVGTGCLVGLPNQTLESLAEDILFFKKIDADMIGIGPFIAHEDTPLKDHKQDNFDLALKVMAITRILLPDINIPATTAMEALRKKGRLIALLSGANVVMPNVSDLDCKKKYLIYPNKPISELSTLDYKEQITADIVSIRRTVSNGYGFRTRKI